MNTLTNSQAVEAAEREKFEQAPLTKHLDKMLIDSAWGVPTSVYKHAHVESLWQGWLARATLASPLEVAAPVSNLRARIAARTETSGEYWKSYAEAMADDYDELARLYAASRAPVAVGVTTKTDLARIWRVVNGGNRWPSDVDAFVNAVLATQPAGAGGSVGASREQDSFHVVNAETKGVPMGEPVATGFIARHADRSKTDTTISAASADTVSVLRSDIKYAMGFLYSHEQIGEPLKVCARFGNALQNQPKKD